MTKQIAKKEQANVSTEVMDMGAFGTENVLSSDLKLPRIKLVQALSDAVNDPGVNARPGEIRDNFEQKLLGGLQKPFQVIPFYSTNTWVMNKEVNGKMEFGKVVPRLPGDERREYNFTWEKDDIAKTKGGEPGNQIKTFNLFVLIKEGNLQVPYLVSFGNYSFKYAAEPYLKKTPLLRTENKSPAHIVWNLSSRLVDENEKGKFYAFVLEPAKDEKGNDIKNSMEEVAAAYSQYKFVSSMQVDMSEKPDQEVKTETRF